MVTLLPEATRSLGVPRTLHFPRPLGSPIGRPNDPTAQAHDLDLCLEMAAKLQSEEMAEYGDDGLLYPL